MLEKRYWASWGALSPELGERCAGGPKALSLFSQLRARSVSPSNLTERTTSKFPCISCLGDICVYKKSSDGHPSTERWE